MQFLFTLVICALLCAGSHAFSLLGPFEEWQTPALGYNPFGVDRGAPKNLGEEYRWNIPVITYGFDREFMDYFGLQGAAAIEEAFDLLNQLPPASEMDLDTFPLDSRRPNYRAYDANLLDVHSTALALIIEQLGLAAPEHWTWALRGRQVIVDGVGTSVTNYTVMSRNFDPFTWEPSPYVNELRFSYRTMEFENPPFADAVEYNIADPAQYPLTSLAGALNPFNSPLSPGIKYTNLTKDDAGGLRYLLHPGNLNFEPLPPGVFAPGDSPTNFVNEALRPGVNKIRFTPVSADWQQTPGWQQTLTFTDRYYDGIELREQTLQRTITQPDILFTVAELETENIWPKQFQATAPRFAQAVGSTQPGPGILTPGVVLTFGRLGLLQFNQYPGETTEETSGFAFPRWGTFDFSTNPPVAFPIGFAGFRTARLQAELASAGGPTSVRWHIRGTPTITYTLQRSTDLKTWEDVETFQTESGHYIFTTEPQGTHKVFYRTISTGP